jgi:ferredoxin-2, mitochondrial
MRVRLLWSCLRSGLRTETEAVVGETLLSVAHRTGVDLEGACEGSCACSTCHVILEETVYSRLPEPSDEENDMLDMAYGLSETSRLGCQVKVEPYMHNATIEIPAATRNFSVDGHRPQHH